MRTIDENIKRLISSISCMLLAEDIDPYKYDRDACIKKINRCVSPTLLKRVFMENEDAIIEQMKSIKG